MATVLDTSALIVFLRRGIRTELRGVATAARDELSAGRGLLSAVTAAELLVGARDEVARERLTSLLDSLPVVPADREVAELAGRMGAAARAAGGTVPVPDLLIAATAVWLDVPLLACDSDFGRGRRLQSSRAAASPWRSLRLHPASVV